MTEISQVELEVVNDPVHYKFFDLNAAGAIQTGFSIVLFGYALRNVSTSATAALDFYDGTDTSGQTLFPLTFAASESIGDWFGPNGILLKNGCYANVTSGEVKGSIFFHHVRI